MYLVNEFANNYFKGVMQRMTKEVIGLSYFEERGFTDQTINKFDLGYALDEWDAFTNAALKKEYQLVS